MDFLVDLFGGTGGTAILGILALGIVLVLIVFVVWLFKLLNKFTQRIGRISDKRLRIIDITHIDQKRQLIIIRRDDVEHLLMIGGERDLVIETGIEPPKEMPAKNGLTPKTKTNKTVALSKGISAPIGALGAKSLRHTGLMKHQDDIISNNNPQTSGYPNKKSEPGFTDSDKAITNRTDSLEEADVIFSDIEKNFEKDSDKTKTKRRKTDK